MRPQLEFSCPESWNAMSPQEGGRYCSSCEKVITDFSKMSTEEIIRQMNPGKGEKSCGSFKAYQLQEPFNDKRNLLIRFYQRVSVSGKTKFPRFISLGLVTLLLLLSGCHRRMSGFYHIPSKREMKKSMKQQEQMEKDGRKKLKRIKGSPRPNW
jgi:hypothetical protein